MIWPMTEDINTEQDCFQSVICVSYAEEDGYINTVKVKRSFLLINLSLINSCKEEYFK